MWLFKREEKPQETHVTGEDIELLTTHGLPPGSNSYITIISGIKDKRIVVGDIGRILPTLAVSCTQCKEPASWGKGDSVTEKHWSIDEHNPGNSVGLSLECFEFAFRMHLAEAWMGGKYLDHGRLALVRVELSDLLSLRTDAFSSQRGQEHALSLEHLRRIGPVDLKARKLKVLDLVDAIRLVPRQSIQDAIADQREQSEESREEWHRLVDAIQPVTWREFLAKFAALTERMGVS